MPSDARYYCEVCRKPIAKKDRVQHEKTRTHVRRATGVRDTGDHPCRFCPHRSTRSYDANRHEQTCPYNPNSERALKRKRNDETAQAVYQCRLERLSGVDPDRPSMVQDGWCSSLSLDTLPANAGGDEGHTHADVNVESISGPPESSPPGKSSAEITTPAGPLGSASMLPISDQGATASRRKFALSFLRQPIRDPPPPARGQCCPICQKYVENKADVLIAHLNTHRGDDFEHMCDVCQIGFQHKEDLQFHLKCASERIPHCGFNYEHTCVCTGHHPPDTHGRSSGASEHDRLKFEYLARNWEGGQLRTLIESIDRLLAEQSQDPYRWSTMTRTKSRWSMSSRTETIASFRSTPTNIDYSARRSEGADEARLRRGTSALARTVLDAHKQMKGLTKSNRAASKLAKAIEHISLTDVERLLKTGVQIITSHLQRALLMAISSNRPGGRDSHEYLYERYQIVKRLLEARSHWARDLPVEETLTSTLPKAIELGDHLLVKLLSDHGADIRRIEDFDFSHALLKTDSDMRALLIGKIYLATIDDHKHDLAAKLEYVQEYEW